MLAIPKVAVLLASYNGAEWLKVQLQSILANEGVVSHIFLSDDGSTDATLEIARQVCGHRLTILPSEPQGSAGQNFIRLVLEAGWEGFDYVCLADQDDIWNTDKLARAVSVIDTNGVAAYSSDVTAFWPDGKRRYIRKSQPQRKWDYLFGGPGPGNTFVWPVAEANFLRCFLEGADPNLRRQVALHDWAFYAIFRGAGKSWHLDSRSALDYRQHGNNVFGAAKGWKAVLLRIEMLQKGWYRHQVLVLADLVGAQNSVIDYMRAPRLRDFWRTVFSVRECRRKALDAGLLALVFLLMAVLKEKD